MGLMSLWKGNTGDYSVRKRFDPEQDITVHELASIFGQISGAKQSTLFGSQEVFDGLPEGIKRHFKD